MPNLFETISHCPIDDSEMSQRVIAHRTYTLFIAVKFEGLPGSLDFDTEILNSESGERLSSPPQGKHFEKTMEIKKCESRICTLTES